MDRRSDSRTRLLRVVAVVLGGALLLLAPSVSAQAPAIDEYSLELPGARDDVTTDPGPLSRAEPGLEPRQYGVAGEKLASQTTVDAAMDLIGRPLAIAFALGAAAWMFFGLRSARRRVVPHPR